MLSKNLSISEIGEFCRAISDPFADWKGMFGFFFITRLQGEKGDTIEFRFNEWWNQRSVIFIFL